MIDITPPTVDELDSIYGSLFLEYETAEAKNPEIMLANIGALVVRHNLEPELHFMIDPLNAPIPDAFIRNETTPLYNYVVDMFDCELTTPMPTSRSLDPAYFYDELMASFADAG